MLSVIEANVKHKSHGHGHMGNGGAFLLLLLGYCFKDLCRNGGDAASGAEARIGVGCQMPCNARQAKRT